MHNSYGLLFLGLLCCCVRYGYSGRYARDVRTLLSEYEFNRIMMENIPRPYWITYPKQLREKRVVGISTKEHKVRHHGTYEHYKHVTILITLDGKRYKIKLERNDALLSGGIQVKHYIETHQQVITQSVEHCFYHGHVKRDEWSSVAVSTCNGIRGVVQMHNETYIIQPMIGGDEGMEHPHIVFKASVSHEEKCGNSLGQWLPFHELHKGEFVRKLKYLKAVRYRREIETQPPKTMKLALVLDKAVYLGLNLTNTEMTTYAISIANIADLYYRQLNMKIALTYLEYWNLADQFIVSPKLRELLIKFMNFKKVALQGATYDIAYFMTGIDLEGSSVGMAFPDSVCTDRALGISRNPRPFEPQQAATILAHMIGHNLGIEHDEDGGCECNDEFGCIMSTKVLAAGGYHSRMFSNCSKSDLDISLSMEITSCLDGKVPEDFPQECGNSIVERGEECDCGSEEDCLRNDPCCDPDTCLLRYWAQCRSGPCCSNCTVLSRTHMCRDRQTECDVPEFCDGERGECPTNNYVQDGHPCANNTGYCVGGICPTLHQQCRAIWGKEAKGGDSQCFERFNPTGNFNGHCGKEASTGNYAKCMSENILCGLLHCDGGNKEPLFGSDKGFSKTTVSSKGIEYECKIVHGPTMMDMPHMGLVQDGTKCGEGRVCHNTRCEKIQHLPPLSCPGTTRALICSGHGVCTRDDTCYCDHGWSGYDCSIKLNISTVPPVLTTTRYDVSSTTTKGIKVVPLDEARNMMKSTTAADPSAAPVLKEMDGLSTMWLIIILASVVGGLVLVLSFTLFCYRRRTPTKLQTAVTKGLLGSKDGGLDKKKDGSVKHKYIGLGGVLPLYRPDLFMSKKKKRLSSEDESDIGELPPPPTIISDPNSARPEKGILKNSMVKLTSSDDNRRSSDSNDQESVGPYVYDEDDDMEAEEIREILGEDDFEQSLDALDHLPESSSFDFMLPLAPHSSFGMPSLHPSPPPPRRMGRLDLPLSSDYQHQPLLWKGGHMMSPPRSKIIRLRNLDELIRQIDKNTIDLSPSPDEPPVQISPSTCTSEDVRSSETEDRHYHSAPSQSDLSPTSFTSSSTRDTGRPLLGNLSQYLLKRNEFNSDDGNHGDDSEMHQQPIDIPPPMNPLNLRNIFNIGQPPLNRDNDTPLGSQTGENSSLNGTSNSRNGYEKSSGYGSEHDAERFSIEDISRSQSRSQSTSPPSYSAVIRTGPNQIKLVPAGHRAVDGHHHDLHKILDGLPRIDAGTFERSPIQTSSANTPSTGPIPVSKMIRDQIDVVSTPSTGPIPINKSLRDQVFEMGNKPCIDRSLEEIPQDFSVEMKHAKKQHRKSLIKSKRPVSLGVNKGSSDSSSQETVNEGIQVA